MPADEATAAAAFDGLVALANRGASDEPTRVALARVPGLPGELLQCLLRLADDPTGQHSLDPAAVFAPEQRRELVRSLVAYLPRLDEPGRLAALRVLARIAPDPQGLAEVWMQSGVEATRIQAVQLLLAASSVHVSLPLLEARLAREPTETERCWIALALGAPRGEGQWALRALLSDPSPRVRRHAAAALGQAIPPWGGIDMVPSCDGFEWSSAYDSSWFWQSRAFRRREWVETLAAGLDDDDPVVRTATARCVLQGGMRAPELLAILEQTDGSRSPSEHAWRAAAREGLSTTADALLARLLFEAERAARSAPAAAARMEDTTWDFLQGSGASDARHAGDGESTATLWKRWSGLLALRRELALAEADGDRGAVRGEPLDTARRRIAQAVVDIAAQFARLSRDGRPGIFPHASRMGSPVVPLLASEWLARGGEDLDEAVFEEYGRALHAIGAPAAAALALGLGLDEPWFRARILVDWLDTDGLRALLAPALPLLWHREVYGELALLHSQSAWEAWGIADVREPGAESLWIERAYTSLGVEALPVLIPHLDSCVAVVRARTCEALGALGPLPPEALGRIAALLDDPEPRVRYFAARTILRRASAGPAAARARGMLGQP